MPLQHTGISQLLVSQALQAERSAARKTTEAEAAQRNLGLCHGGLRILGLEHFRVCCLGFCCNLWEVEVPNPPISEGLSDLLVLGPGAEVDEVLVSSASSGGHSI